MKRTAKKIKNRMSEKQTSSKKLSSTNIKRKKCKKRDGKQQYKYKKM